MHTTKPSNPISGDTYYDTTNNRVYAYDESSSSWMSYQLYIDPEEKNIIRKNKIRNLLK
jgi:hypothetical protein